MDLAVLGAGVAGVLAPVVPYLMKKAGDKAADEAVRKVGKAAWERARAIWQRLWPKLEKKEAAREAAEALAKEPNDQDALGQLRLQLKKLLAEDHELAEELARLMNEARPSDITVIASGERSVAAGGGISGTVVTGDKNSVDRNQ